MFVSSPYKQYLLFVSSGTVSVVYRGSNRVILISEYCVK